MGIAVLISHVAAQGNQLFRRAAIAEGMVNSINRSVEALSSFIPLMLSLIGPIIKSYI
jgi:hypothetical protein